jgi:hypothetical protein
MLQISWHSSKQSEQRREGKCGPDDVWISEASYRPIIVIKRHRIDTPLTHILIGALSLANQKLASSSPQSCVWMGPRLDERRGEGNRQWLVANGRPRTYWRKLRWAHQRYGQPQ